MKPRFKPRLEPESRWRSKARSRRKSRPELRLLVLVGLLAVVPACLSGCGRKHVWTETVLPQVDVVKVQSKHLERELRLPGELLGFQHVPIYAKVPGYVQSIVVDRGSAVHKGDLLVVITAPELDAKCREAKANVSASIAQSKEAEARLETARSDRNKAEAKLTADQVTFKRLKTASQIPGVVAENDVDVLWQTVVADQAQVAALDHNVVAADNAFRQALEKEKSARHASASLDALRDYLIVKAPYDGMITERNVHVGSFVGQPNDSVPMLKIEELNLLRLVIPVPEIATAGIKPGDTIYFTLPAFPGRTFSGVLKRISHYLDVKTRTEPVELNVLNPDWSLSPGMFPEVHWTERRSYPTLFVPDTAVESSTEKNFVVRVRGNQVDWVEVRRGESMGGLVEIFGDIKEGDEVAMRGTEELRPGMLVCPHLSSEFSK